MMNRDDLLQCGEIYAKAFPMEHWGIDWTADNAREYLTDYFEQKLGRLLAAFLLYVKYPEANRKY